MPLNASGTACVTTNTLTNGTVTAVYNGNGCFKPSTGTKGVTVNNAQTTTALTITPQPRGLRPAGDVLRRSHDQRAGQRHSRRDGHLHRSRRLQPDRGAQRERHGLRHHHRGHQRHGDRRLQRRPLPQSLRRCGEPDREPGSHDADGAPRRRSACG
ncbi:hypothetical protein GCM10020254_24760 [Streptomyces goshikiensis]